MPGINECLLISQPSTEEKKQIWANVKLWKFSSKSYAATEDVRISK